MPMHPAQAAWLLAIAGCAPKYSQLPSIQPADLQAPLPVQHVEVAGEDGMGVDVAWIEAGPVDGSEGLTQFVLVHGLSSYMGFWENQVPELSKQRRVLALDLPGFGASCRPEAPYTPPWYAEMVSRWMGDVGIEKA